MNRTIVLTFVTDDKPGLVSEISNIISQHHGNWLESHLSRLANKFAGIVRVNSPAETIKDLELSLSAVFTDHFKLTIESTTEEVNAPIAERYQFNMELVGNDREGIVHDLTETLVKLNVNIEDMASECTDAPMSSEKIFRAVAKLTAPVDLHLDQIQEALEALANEVMIELHHD